ncbi:MAG: hypothetical protein AAF829_01725 [Pseudomonadota bacterium]
MNTATKIALAALALVTAATGTASAQDYNDWSTISPWGLEMVDQFGNTHYVDPWAHDSQVDAYGNVYSDYYGQMDNSVGMYDLTPSWTDDTSTGWASDSSSYYDSAPYASPSNSHEAFINSIYD